MTPSEAAELLGRAELPPSLGWRSARGEHHLFLWDRRLEGLLASAVAHFGGAELRIGGAEKQLVSVCPPSVGDDRRRRRWNGIWEAAPLPESLLRELDRPPARHARPVPLRPSCPPRHVRQYRTRNHPVPSGVRCPAE